MNTSIALTAMLTAILTALGSAKILAIAPMRARAAHVGFSVTAYRRIGILEIAGAIGLAVGLVQPLLGGLAGTGLLLLLAGAIVTHVRNGDGLREIAPAVVCALLVAGYLAALTVTTP